MRAGQLRDVTTLYRNDLTPTAGSDPHGFLIDPRITGRQLGLIQVATFLDLGRGDDRRPGRLGPDLRGADRRTRRRSSASTSDERRARGGM